MDEQPRPLTEDREVTRVASAIAEAGAFAMDLEFVPEERYVPELALVQVSWGDPEGPEIAAIDPLAVDPRPVLALVADPEVETLLHSAQADLALLSAAFSIEAEHVLDTQIAAGFLGMGDQVGYGPLLEQVLGVHLDKGSQFTDWLQRPLTDRQLAYALDDVRYLPALWGELRSRLEERDRMRWVEQESAELARTADRRPTPDEAFRRVKGWGRLRGRALGALRGLAAWREDEARHRNRPPNRVLGDRSLLELARGTPTTEDDIERVRGIDRGLVRRHGEALLRAVREGAEDPPSLPPARPPDQRVEAWSSVLQGLVRARALEFAVSPRFVATRGDLEQVASWWAGIASSDDGAPGNELAEPDLPLLQGWRRELVGEEILDWLAGRASLSADPSTRHGLRLQRP